MLKIIDSHVHFWDPNRLNIPWLAGVPQLNRVFLPTDFPAQGEGWQMEALVFVEADVDPALGFEEAEWVSSLAQHDKRIQGIVAFAPLEKGAEARLALEKLKTLPLVKGIRRLIQGEGLGFCTQPKFVEGVRLLAEFGFSFDICIRHQQLADAIRLVEQCPEINFVLDHIGKPDIQVGLKSPWQEQLRQLAGFPKVMCKLSGLLTEADLKNWTRANLKPYIEAVLGAFGVDRVMYGSDTPVVQLADRYDTWLSTVQAALSAFSDAEIARIMAENARTFYRL